jgi:hypothetical protein
MAMAGKYRPGLVFDGWSWVYLFELTVGFMYEY